MTKDDPTDGQARIWWRALLAGGSIGPGKIELLRRVAETGSVSAAARQMRMSHARSQKLVAELNRLGAKPLIETRSGGEAGGGAALTPLGRKTLELCGELDAMLQDTAQAKLRALTEALGA